MCIISGHINSGHWGVGGLLKDTGSFAAWLLTSSYGLIMNLANCTEALQKQRLNSSEDPITNLGGRLYFNRC